MENSGLDFFVFSGRIQIMQVGNDMRVLAEYSYWMNLQMLSIYQIKLLQTVSSNQSRTPTMRFFVIDLYHLCQQNVMYL